MWEDILKKGRQTGNKINGEYLKEAIAGHLHDTGYRDIYYKTAMSEDILERYLDIKRARGGRVNRIRSKVQLNNALMRYVPKGYTRQLLDGELKRKLGIKESNKGYIRIWLKDSFYSDLKKAVRLSSDKLRAAIAEYLEETGYKDIYFKSDIMADITKKYKRLAIGNHHKPARLKRRLNMAMMSYAPKGYKHYVLTGKLKKYLNIDLPVGSQSFWLKDTVPLPADLRKSKEVEKLRTDSGERLRLKDWGEFKLRLRRMLNTEVPVNIYGRKSSVRIVDGPIVGDKAVIDISFRSHQGDRRYVNVNFIEEDGDYLFTNVEGDIQIPDTEIFNSEFKLRERITEMVVEELTFEDEEQDLRQKEEEELTEEENIRQLEAANPDSRWDREKGRLVPREIESEEPPARNLTLEEAAKLGRADADKERKKKENIARLRSMKENLKNLSAHRGKRGRRDVS